MRLISLHLHRWSVYRHFWSLSDYKSTRSYTLGKGSFENNVSSSVSRRKKNYEKKRKLYHEMIHDVNSSSNSTKIRVAISHSHFICGWSGVESTITKATKWPIVPALDDDDEWCGALGGMLYRGNRITRRKPTWVPPPLSTTDPTWFDPRSNPDPRGGKPVIICLAYRPILHLTI
jgi:hypothetical protein